VDDHLTIAARRMAEVELELTSKGFPHGTVARGVARARGAAEFHTRQIQTPALRHAAFLEILGGELANVEDWCRRQLAYFDISVP
jgi:hypothetical protein